MCTLVTVHQTVHSVWECFIVCQLHLKEIELKIRIGNFREMEKSLGIGLKGN